MTRTFKEFLEAKQRGRHPRIGGRDPRDPSSPEAEKKRIEKGGKSAEKTYNVSGLKYPGSGFRHGYTPGEKGGNYKESKEETSTIKCPGCGGEATQRTYFNQNSGFEETETSCPNKNCPTNHGKQHLAQFI